MMPFGMNPASPMLPADKPTDQPMGQAPNNLDEEDVMNCLMTDFANDVKDKEEFGWLDKRDYDLRAYYGVKDAAMMNRPWPGASAYPVPITPTLLDTGHANVKASMRSDDGNWATVKGIGEEDIRKAVPLAALLNWQLGNQIPTDKIEDLNIFRTLLHGNGIIKVLQDIQKSCVKLISIDIENIFVPIDADGVQFGDNHGHFTQIIPLSQNDINYRKSWGIYENLEQMVPGARISTNRGNSSERMQQLRDNITGQDKEGRQRRETYFMAETYKEYFPKSSSGYGDNGSASRAFAKPTKITVWWSPNGGVKHRIAVNQDGIVPFANHDFYPFPGYFFSMSLPEKIKNVQEKANYADKQNTDAMDRSISPAMFVSDTAELEKSRAKRIPGGIYNLGRDQQIVYEPQPPRERGFEVEIQRMWQEAQNLTGLIDISIGGQAKSNTLGQDEIRSFRADIRFADVLDRYQRGFRDTLDLIYHYDNKFMDRGTKVKVLGYSDYKTVDELFPNPNAEMGLGIEGKFDFSFAGMAITDRDKIKMDRVQFFSALLTDPSIAADPHDSWNVKEQLAEAYGIRDIETHLNKPYQALIMSAQETIQRVVSGQTGMQVRPGIDTLSYTFEIEFFMRSEAFVGLKPELQMELLKILKDAYLIQAAENKALMDMRLVQQRQMADQQASAIANEADKRAQMKGREMMPAATGE